MTCRPAFLGPQIGQMGMKKALRVLAALESFTLWLLHREKHFAKRTKVICAEVTLRRCSFQEPCRILQQGIPLCPQFFCTKIRKGTCIFIAYGI